MTLTSKVTALMPRSFSWAKHGTAAAMLLLLIAGRRHCFATAFSLRATGADGRPGNIVWRFCHFSNASGDQSLDWLGTSLAQMLSTDVGQSASLRVVPRSG